MPQAAVVLSKAKFAQQLEVSPDSVDRAIKRGEIKVIRFGRRVLIPREELARILRGDSGSASKDGGA